MKRIKNLVMKNKKTKVAAALAILAVTAGSALAFLLIIATGSGTSTEQSVGTNGTAAIAVHVNVTGPALTPGAGGGTDTYQVMGDGLASAAFVTKQPTTTIVTSDPVNCPASDFVATPDSTGISFPVKVNGPNNVIGGGTVVWNDSGVDQSGCIGQTWHITATVPAP